MCMSSAGAAYRPRRTGKPLPKKQGMAGEQRVWVGLERSEPWALALTAVYGVILVAIAVAVHVAAGRLVPGDLFPTVVIGGAGAAFVVYAIHRARHGR